jgi:hypothetical protein
MLFCAHEGACYRRLAENQNHIGRVGAEANFKGETFKFMTTSGPEINAQLIPTIKGNGHIETLEDSWVAPGRNECTQ